MKIKRGEIYHAHLGSQREHILGGYHRVIIVQADVVNHIEGQSLTIVVPITSTVKRFQSGFDVKIPAGVADLTKESIAQCQQVRVLPINRLCNPPDVIGDIHPVGTLPEDLMNQVEMNLLFLLGLPQSQ